MGRLRSFLALLGAVGMPSRYAILPGSWVLFFWFLWSEPVLRLPLLVYLPYIWSRPGQRAVDCYRGPTILCAGLGRGCSWA